MSEPWVYMCSPSWTPLPPPSTSHPSGSSQCTSPEHPVSCMEPGLVICFTYDNIYHSMLFSQIIPLSPSLTESKTLFYTSVSFLLSCIYDHHYHLSKFHIYALISCIGVFLSDLLQASVWKWKLLSGVQPFMTPWTIPSMEFSRPEYFPFSRGSSQPRDRTQVSRVAGGFFTSWATRKASVYHSRNGDKTLLYPLKVFWRLDLIFVEHLLCVRHYF